MALRNSSFTSCIETAGHGRFISHPKYAEKPTMIVSVLKPTKTKNNF